MPERSCERETMVKLSVEFENFHDAIMLSALIEMWKEKWESEYTEDDDDDAEDESSDCDVECSEDDDDAERKAHEEALRKLADALRNCGAGDFSFRYSGHAVRRKNRG